MNLLKNSKIYKRLSKCLPFILPSFLWVLLYGRIHSQRFILAADAQSFFIVVNNYLNHIMQGVYPLWSPFASWGRPYGLTLRAIGELNPFLYSILVFHKLGFSFTLSFYLYLILYSFAGFAGFYFLAKKIFANQRSAYLSFILIMFSTLSLQHLVDTITLLIFVPAVWFFYFLVSFTQTYHRRDFVGLTFSLMLLATAYLPFYFITICSAIFAVFTLCYPFRLWDILKKTCKFLRTHKYTALFCLISLVISLCPGIYWYLSGHSSEFVFSTRYSEGLAKNSIVLPIGVIDTSGLLGFDVFQKLFSDLMYAGIGACYIPVFAFMILAMGLLLPLSRRLILFALLGLFIFLLMLADLTPVHKFLYDHVFFFRYFRNLHFFLFIAAIPLFICFVAEQFRILSGFTVNSRKEKIYWILYTAAVHSAFAVFLYFQEKVVLSTYVNIAASFLFFVLYMLYRSKIKTDAWAILLFIVVAMQPLEVFSHIRGNSQENTFQFLQEPHSVEDTQPVFLFNRPIDKISRETTRLEKYGAVSDTSGFETGEYVGAKNSFLMHQKMDQSRIKNYVANKFIVYDRIKKIGINDHFWDEVENSLSDKQNVAYVFEDVSDYNGAESGKQARAAYIERNSDRFNILGFGLNYIRFKTDFDTGKFLVYNDSFYSGWHAFINGREVKLYRANIAFKGVWLPAGENEVLLRYNSRRIEALHIFLIFYFIMFLVWLILSHIRPGRPGMFYEK